jgi:hypothetical protein
MSNATNHDHAEFWIGDQAVVWQGRWIGQDGMVIQVLDLKLQIQTDAGGVIKVWKNGCCLILDRGNNDKEAIADVDTDESADWDDIAWPVSKESDGSALE